MLNIFNRTKQPAGDTLVEVMISIAIVALAIAIAYAISGKNLNVGITARERTSATGLVQGQIERMSEAIQVNASVLANLDSSAKHFCFDVNNVSNTTPVLNGVINPANNKLGPPDNDALHYTTGANSCVSGAKYYLDISYVTPGGAGLTGYGKSYAFTAKWYRIGGGVDQIVTLYYRPQ